MRASKYVNPIEVGRLVGHGYISERKHESLPLRIYNYTPKAMYERHWTKETLRCRGLIVDGEHDCIVALPFEKFFNWGEPRVESPDEPPVGLHEPPDCELVEVTDKLDGSLGIGYYNENSNRWEVSTRGTFTSPQAEWATAHLWTNYKMETWPKHLTPLFEIVYQENRIVIDYQGEENLHLIGVRDRYGGHDLFHSVYKVFADQFGFLTPVNDFGAMDRFEPELYKISAESMSVNLDEGGGEGVVLRFANGVRLKVKGEEYSRLHRLIHGLSFKRVVEAMAEDKLTEYLDVMPDEFQDEILSWQHEIEEKFASVIKEVAHAYASAPKASRKEFALWVMANHPGLSTYLFLMVDGKEITEAVYRREF